MSFRIARAILSFSLSASSRTGWLMLRRWSIVGIVAGVVLSIVQLVAAPAALAFTAPTLTNVNVYSGPGSSNGLVGTIAAKTTVSFHCFVAGQDVTGQYSTEDLWDALDSGGFVPDALVFTDSNHAVVPACPSSEFGTGNYPVAWTGGSGVQPMSGTSTSTSPDGSVLPDGQVVTVTCETTGQTLTDSANFTSDFWDQLNSGAYIPNVYIDTQVNGPTPGVPACAPPSAGSGGSTGGGNGQGGGSGGAPTPTAQPVPTVAAPQTTPAAPTASATAGNSQTTTQCQQPSGTYIANNGGMSVPYALYDHYMWDHGTPVVIAWSFLAQSASFVKKAEGIPVGQTAEYRDSYNTAMFWALGTFTITRTSESCYAIYDHYDFTPTAAPAKLPFTIFTLPEWAYQLSGAKDFDVRAAGQL